jgi:hypothetical protein
MSPTQAEYLEMQHVGVFLRAIQVEADVVGIFQRRRQLDILRRVLRTDLFNVTGGQCLAVTGSQLVATLLAIARDQFLAQVVGPVAYDLGNAHIELACIPFRTRTALRPHDRMHARQR